MKGWLDQGDSCLWAIVWLTEVGRSRKCGTIPWADGSQMCKKIAEPNPAS